jgi:hypothetical protein
VPEIGKYVEVPGRGRSIEVEESVVALALEIVRAGFDLAGADRDQVGWARVAFGSPEDALGFLNAIARYVPEGEPFHSRMRGDSDPRAWKYAIRPEMDVAWGGGDEGLNWRPPSRFRFSVAVRFPYEDLQIVTELLRDFNAVPE